MIAEQDDKHTRDHISFRKIWKDRDDEEPQLLEKILSRDNLKSACRRVKASGGAPGVDGMHAEEAKTWFDENGREFMVRILKGKYTPRPVLHTEVQKKGEAGVLNITVSTVPDRIIQQAIVQQIMPIYEQIFADGNYCNRPGRSAQAAGLKVLEYTQQGYTNAAIQNLSESFALENFGQLLNILRRNITDERVIQIIKRILKSGIMEGDTLTACKEGILQGGTLAPLIANIYLNEFDQEFAGRGVPVVRYAGDIVLLAKSRRAAERLLETSSKYLEGSLRLRVNENSGRVICICPEDFKDPDFLFGKDKNGFPARGHDRSAVNSEHGRC